MEYFNGQLGLITVNNLIINNFIPNKNFPVMLDYLMFQNNSYKMYGRKVSDFCLNTNFIDKNQILIVVYICKHNNLK